MVVSMNMTPLPFQVSVINDDWISLKVVAMMKKRNYKLGTRLKKKKTGILELPDFKG